MFLLHVFSFWRRFSSEIDPGSSSKSSPPIGASGRSATRLKGARAGGRGGSRLAPQVKLIFFIPFTCWHATLWLREGVPHLPLGHVGPTYDPSLATVGCTRGNAGIHVKHARASIFFTELRDGLLSIVTTLSIIIFRPVLHFLSCFLSINFLLVLSYLFSSSFTFFSVFFSSSLCVLFSMMRSYPFLRSTSRWFFPQV